METPSEKKSNKKVLIIIGAIVVGIILIFVIRTICVNAAVDHAYDRGVKEYNKAYDKATKDMERTMRQYNY